MDQNKVHHANSLGHYLGFSQQDLRRSDRGDFTRRSSSASSISWSFQRSKSLFCLPTVNCSSASEIFHFSEPFQFLNTGSPASRLKTWRCSPRLNIDDLEGAQETDVDTGMKLSFSDLSVVSAYSALNGFCNDLEASLPPQKRALSKAKEAATGGRPASATCNTFESADGSLPSLSDRSSISFVSASLSKQPKQSSRAAPCSLDGHGSVCPASPANEEEFYIWGLSYTFQGKHILLVNDSSGPTLSLQKVPRWGEVMQQSMLSIWRKHSDRSEMGVPKLCAVKQSELVPCTFLLEEMISTEARPWPCKVDGLYDWPLDWWWRKYQKRQITIQFSLAENEE